METKNKGSHAEAKTGFASIDRPQMKYYREEPIRNFDREQTVYDLIFKSNSGNMLSEAIGYLGDTLSFQELKDAVDKTAEAYYNSGLRQGDVVTIMMMNTPEVPIIFLALNKIGAVSKWIDAGVSPEDLCHYINEHQCKMAVTLDAVLLKITAILDQTSLEKVLVISPKDFLSPNKNALIGEHNPSKISAKYVSFYTFIQNQENKSVPESQYKASFDRNRLSLIIQSSGTTGKSKRIMHTDYSFTSLAHQVSYSDIPFVEKNTILVVLPPFVAFGLCNSLLIALSFGMKAELSPTLEPKTVFDQLGKFNICFGAPFLYRYLVEHNKEINRGDLKKVDVLFSGGDKLSIEELNEFKSQLNHELVNGWGNNEGLGAVTFNPTKANKFGTIGIPKYGDTVIVINSETGEELKYNEVGELCFCSDTSFMGYAGDEIGAKEVLRVHDDGKTWVHTGDLGSIDEEGYITHLGRIQRVIVRMGFKTSPYTIEDKILSHPDVKECVVVGVPDKADDFVPMVFYCVSAGSDPNKIEQELIQTYCSKLTEYLIPKYYQCMEELPYTANNKYDFKLLEAMGAEYVENLG